MVSFPQVSPPELCAHLSPPPIRATCPAHLIFLDLLVTVYRTVINVLLNMQEFNILKILL